MLRLERRHPSISSTIVGERSDGVGLGARFGHWFARDSDLSNRKHLESCVCICSRESHFLFCRLDTSTLLPF